VIGRLKKANQHKAREDDKILEKAATIYSFLTFSGVAFSVLVKIYERF
jgi:hypothetical protein